MKIIVCDRTGARFAGTPGEALADGWRLTSGTWESPAMGWDRHPDVSVSREHVAYENGIDFDAVPLNFGGA